MTQLERIYTMESAFDRARAALAAGSITIESTETISPEMSAELLKARMDTTV